MKTSMTEVEREIQREYTRRWRRNFPEANKASRQKSRQKRILSGASREEKRKRRLLDPEKIRAEARNWRKNNLEKARASDRNRNRVRYHTDPTHRLIVNLRSRLGNSIRRSGAKGKSDSTLGLTGCTIAELWDYLEILFKPGMTKENWGPVWHIDHKKPLDSFDLSDPKQQKECFHWSNLQPLFAEENLKKGASV